MVRYLDQARSIDARCVMSAALKGGRRNGYDKTLDWPDPVCRDQGAFLHPTLTIDLQWPEAATEPVHGTVRIRYPGTTGQVIEQRVQLQGTPARVGGWQWQFTCPDSKRQVRTLYLAPDGNRFQSREAADLKSRPLSRIERHERSYFRLMRQLQAPHWSPVIAKPAGMAVETYDRLCDQLDHARARVLCAALGRPEPEFWDTEPKLAKPKSSRLKSRPKSQPSLDLRANRSPNLQPGRQRAMPRAVAILGTSQARSNCGPTQKNLSSPLPFLRKPPRCDDCSAARKRARFLLKKHSLPIPNGALLIVL
jgi:hypothetical protein